MDRRARPVFSVDLLAKSPMQSSENNASSVLHSSLYYPGKTTFGGSMSHKRRRPYDRGTTRASRSSPPKKKLQYLHQTVRNTIRQQDGCHNCRNKNVFPMSNESGKDEEKEASIVYTKTPNGYDKSEKVLATEQKPFTLQYQKQAPTVRTFNFSSPLFSNIESKVQQNGHIISKSFTFCTPHQAPLKVDDVST